MNPMTSAADIVGLSDRRLGVLRSWQERQLREFIDAHLDTKLRVVDLGRVVRLSAAHFNRVFKGTFGRTPHAYLMRRRVELARMLILKGDFSLSEIAGQCGFADQAHFCRHFRLAMGVSPAAWRREHSTRRRR
jgi:AraC family transcriptional regulator